MPGHTRVAVLIQVTKPHPKKQEAVCLRHAEQHAMSIVALVHDPAACVPMIVAGLAGGILVAIDPGGDLAATIEAVGGQLFIARGDTQPRVRREVGIMVARMAKLGLAPKDIAHVLEVSTSEVSKALSRLRHRPGREGDRGEGG
jgi:hypothetical protein